MKINTINKICNLEKNIELLKKYIRGSNKKNR